MYVKNLKAFLIRIGLSSALLTCPLALSDETKLEIIPLKHLTVEQAIPLIEPFVPEQGTVTGMNNQLILRTTPANLEQIKEILDNFDVAPLSLLITVKQDAGRDSLDSETSLSGNIRSGDVQAAIGDPPADPDSVELRLRRRDTQADDANTQQLRATEGYEAFIQVGQSIPVVEESIDGSIHSSVGFKDVTTGFTVLPRLNGDVVTLEINPHREKLNRSDGSIDVQRISTSVSGRLGEWIDLGGVVKSSHHTGSGIFSSTESASNSQGSVRLKVERLD